MVTHNCRAFSVTRPVTTGRVSSRSGEVSVGIRTRQNVMFVWLFPTPFDGASVFIQTGFAIDIGFVTVKFIDVVCD